MKYRDRLEILYSMLKPIQEKGPIGKTQMMFRGGTSHSLFKEYLKVLQENGIVSTNNDMEPKIALSDRGYRFVGMYEQLMEIFDTRKIRE